MKKFAFFISASIIVVSIFIIKIQTGKKEYEAAAVLQKAFDTTGARVVSSEIYMRGKLGAEELEDEGERRRLISCIIAGAGGDTAAIKPEFLPIDNDSSYGTEADYIIDDTRGVKISILKVMESGNEKHPEYQMMASFTDTSQRQDIAESVGKIMRAMRRNGINPDVNICITGNINGILKESELEELCSRVFDSVEADEVEGMRDRGMISVSAFSHSIGDPVRINGKPVNLNLAVRYNSYEGKTYIWLATPVITTEY